MFIMVAIPFNIMAGICWFYFYIKILILSYVFSSVLSISTCQSYSYCCDDWQDDLPLGQLRADW